jgi:hypothetical protein
LNCSSDMCFSCAGFGNTWLSCSTSYWT